MKTSKGVEGFDASTIRSVEGLDKSMRKITVIHMKQWRSNGERVLTKIDVRRVLGIQTRDTLNEDLAALGMDEKGNFKVSDVAELLKLRLYLGARPGIHSREEYKDFYKDQPALLEYKFQEWGVDLDAHLLRVNQLIGTKPNDYSRTA